MTERWSSGSLKAEVEDNYAEMKHEELDAYLKISQAEFEKLVQNLVFAVSAMLALHNTYRPGEPVICIGECLNGTRSICD